MQLFDSITGLEKNVLSHKPGLLISFPVNSHKTQVGLSYHPAIPFYLLLFIQMPTFQVKVPYLYQVLLQYFQIHLYLRPNPLPSLLFLILLLLLFHLWEYLAVLHPQTSCSTFIWMMWQFLFKHSCFNWLDFTCPLICRMFGKMELEGTR